MNKQAVRTAGGQHRGINHKKLNRSPPNHAQPGEATIDSFVKINLDRFSEEERHAILSVVKRDLELQCIEKHRLKKIRRGLLQQDCQALLSLPGASSNCVICKSLFILLLNPRVTCDLCRREICKNCIKKYNDEMLCSICAYDIFYRAMVCQWFYNHSQDKLSDRASEAIVKSLFKNDLPAINDLTEEQLHQTVSSYLGSEGGTYVNGVIITPKVMQKIQRDQIKTFVKRYQEIRGASLKALLAMKGKAMNSNEESINKEVEYVTSQFLQQVEEALRKLLQMLCIAEEKYRLSADVSTQSNTSIRVLEIAKKQVELLVNHEIKIPDDYTKAEIDEDLESYVASVTGGPENFFANILLEDLKNALKNS